MDNPYIPEPATITDIHPESPLAKTYTVSLKNPRPFEFRPGQFIELSLFGKGEFPVSLSGVPDPENGVIQVTVRRAGLVTANLDHMPVGSTIGIRGPFGNGFPLERLAGRDIVLVAGGVGICPLKSLLETLLQYQNGFGRLILLYGAASPQELLFKDVLSSLVQASAGDRSLRVLLTVDNGAPGWDGHMGLVTDLFNQIKLSPRVTSAALCGPGTMMKSAAQNLLCRGIAENELYLSFERKMQCGMGMCGHCTIGHSRVCVEGPVFTYDQVKKVAEPLWQPREGSPVLSQTTNPALAGLLQGGGPPGRPKHPV